MPVTLSASAEALSEAKGKGLARRRQSSFAEFILSEANGLRACPERSEGMTARTPLKEFTLSEAKGSREAFSPNVYR